MDSAAWLLTLLRNHSLHKCRHDLADNIDHEDYDGHERGALNEHLRVKVADEQRQRHVRDVCEERYGADHDHAVNEEVRGHLDDGARGLRDEDVEGHAAARDA